MRHRWLRWALTVGLLGVIGCGSGGTNSTPPPSGRSGTVTGSLGANAAGATIKLEGTGLTTRCDGAGAFRLDGVPEGEYTLSIASTSLQGNAVMIRVIPGQTTDVPPVQLQAAGMIAGLVESTDSQGRLTPVAGARVLARPVPLLAAYEGKTPPAFVNAVAAAGANARRQATDAAAEPPLREAVTDANGAFTIVAVIPGPYSVEVTADGYEAGETGTYVDYGHTATADVSLVRIDPNNAQLSGHVEGVQNGQTLPLADVRVDLWPVNGPLPPMMLADAGGSIAAPTDTSQPTIGMNDNPWYIPPFWYGKSVYTDSSGAFSVTNLPPGQYTLSFHRFGYSALTQTITFTAQQHAVSEVTLTYTLATVSGTVYGRSNGSTQPLAGAWVTAYGYVILPAGDLGGNAGSTGGGTVAEALTSSGASATSVGVIGGNSGSGMPALRPPGVAETDANGHYTLQVEAGQVEVNAWAAGYDASFVNVDVPLSGRSGVDLVLDVSTGTEPPANTANGHRSAPASFFQRHR